MCFICFGLKESLSMSKIKFLKASPVYPTYLNAFYSANLGLENKTYSEQYSLIMADCYGWADFWKKNLEKNGEFEVFEAITNAEHLQKTWAKEHNIVYKEENWFFEILTAQIIEFRPDVFFPHDYVSIKPDFVKKIKRLVPEIKVVIGYDGIALNDFSRFSECNLMFSILDKIVDYYNSKGIHSKFVKFGFETGILERIKNNDKKYDSTFVGSLALFEGGHHERFELLKYLANHTNTKFWILGLTKDWSLTCQAQLTKLYSFQFSDYYNIWNLGRKNHTEVFGLEMYQLLKDSKITINSHIDRAGTKAGNMRLFEATGVGTCLITDWKENIHDFFEVDKEVVVYKTPSECASKIKYLLKNPTEMQKIAIAGQKRTVKEYPLSNTINIIAEEVKKIL